MYFGNHFVLNGDRGAGVEYGDGATRASDLKLLLLRDREALNNAYDTRLGNEKLHAAFISKAEGIIESEASVAAE